MSKSTTYDHSVFSQKSLDASWSKESGRVCLELSNLPIFQEHFFDWGDTAIGGIYAQALRSDIKFVLLAPDPEETIKDHTGLDFSPPVFRFEHCDIDNLITAAGRSEFRKEILEHAAAAKELAAFYAAIFKAMLTTNMMSTDSRNTLKTFGDLGKSDGSTDYKDCIMNQCPFELLTLIRKTHTVNTTSLHLKVFKEIADLKDETPIYILKPLIERWFKEILEHWGHIDHNGDPVMNIKHYLVTVFLAKRPKTLFTLENQQLETTNMDIRKQPSGYLSDIMHTSNRKEQMSMLTKGTTPASSKSSVALATTAPTLPPATEPCTYCYDHFGNTSYHHPLKGYCNNIDKNRTRDTHSHWVKTPEQRAAQAAATSASRPNTRPSSPSKSRSNSKSNKNSSSQPKANTAAVTTASAPLQLSDLESLIIKLTQRSLPASTTEQPSTVVNVSRTSSTQASSAPPRAPPANTYSALDSEEDETDIPIFNFRSSMALTLVGAPQPVPPPPVVSAMTSTAVLDSPSSDDDAEPDVCPPMTASSLLEHTREELHRRLDTLFPLQAPHSTQSLQSMTTQERMLFSVRATAADLASPVTPSQVSRSLLGRDPTFSRLLHSAQSLPPNAMSSYQAERIAQAAAASPLDTALPVVTEPFLLATAPDIDSCPPLDDLSDDEDDDDINTGLCPYCAQLQHTASHDSGPCLSNTLTTRSSTAHPRFVLQPKSPPDYEVVTTKRTRRSRSRSAPRSNSSSTAPQQQPSPLPPKRLIQTRAVLTSHPLPPPSHSIPPQSDRVSQVADRLESLAGRVHHGLAIQFGNTYLDPLRSSTPSTSSAFVVEELPPAINNIDITFSPSPTSSPST